MDGCPMQALEAKEQGIADVCRLLFSPEDLGRLEQYRAEVCGHSGSCVLSENKHSQHIGCSGLVLWCRTVCRYDSPNEGRSC
jgi:hypothetical protein